MSVCSLWRTRSEQTRRSNVAGFFHGRLQNAAQPTSKQGLRKALEHGTMESLARTPPHEKSQTPSRHGRWHAR